MILFQSLCTHNSLFLNPCTAEIYLNFVWKIFNIKHFCTQTFHASTEIAGRQEFDSFVCYP